jgi:hypothetical protein
MEEGDAVMAEPVSVLRLNAMRGLFLLNFLYLGSFVVRAFVVHAGPWDPVRGVAYSFWGALALLSAAGLRFPLKLVPVLLMQFVYKTIWLLAVYLPMGSDGGSGLITPMLGGALVDALVIPWAYVWTTFLAAPSDRWRAIPLDRPGPA